MKTYIPKIIGKPSDYWICKECNGLNWYENEECTGENQGDITCKGKQPKLSNKRDKKVLNWVEKELEFYKEEYDYTEDDCDNIEIYV